MFDENDLLFQDDGSFEDDHELYARLEAAERAVKQDEEDYGLDDDDAEAFLREAEQQAVLSMETKPKFKRKAPDRPIDVKPKVQSAESSKRVKSKVIELSSD